MYPTDCLNLPSMKKVKCTLPIKRDFLSFYSFVSRLVLCLAVTVTLTTTCKKTGNAPAAVLPPITQEGKNIFGCNINGKVWVPHYPCKELIIGAKEFIYVTTPLDSTRLLPVHFAMALGNNDAGQSFLNIGPRANGFFLHKPGNIIDSLDINYISHGSFYNKYTGRDTQYYFEITKLDTINKIISGVFAFTLYNSSDPLHSDSVVIAEGRFDISIGNYNHCSDN